MTTNGMTGGAGPNLRRLAPALAVGAVLFVLATVGISKMGCANHHTPAGHVGYVKSRPIMGAGEFVGTQKGPTSTGWVWRQEVVNIDVRTRTYSEEMTIPTSNQLQLTLNAYGRMRLRPDKVREVVEKFGGENWYVNNVRDQFRATVRDKVQKLAEFEVKDQMRAIGDAVLTDMQKRYADTPIEFLSVDVGDIKYPKGVVDSVVRKFVTSEENERRDIELEIAQKQIEIGIAEAQGIADAQKIIRTTLDPMFLQFEALRAIEELAGAPNTTFLMMPIGKDGSSPIIMNLESK
ncbi:MAG TPA: SPFH domain-containing protein [Kofleriaceae bacterium]|nr:SPFH domain-containing protein [Kofleriaceae bacterium]